MDDREQQRKIRHRLSMVMASLRSAWAVGMAEWLTGGSVARDSMRPRSSCQYRACAATAWWALSSGGSTWGRSDGSGSRPDYGTA